MGNNPFIFELLQGRIYQGESFFIVLIFSFYFILIGHRESYSKYIEV